MEQILTDFILRLKGERKFATAIKNGLRLIGSLQEHDLSVLYELFPWIGEAIRGDLPPAPSAPDSGDLERQISAAVQVGVQQAIMNLPAQLPASPMVAAPLKPSAGTLGAGKVMALPTFDDDDDGDTIVIKAGKKTTSYDNLLASMFKADERADKLYEERLAAGEIDPRTGRSISKQVSIGLD